MKKLLIAIMLSGLALGAMASFWQQRFPFSPVVREAQFAPSLVWCKVNNTIPNPSDSSNTDGRIGYGTSGKGDASGGFFEVGVFERDGTLFLHYRGLAADNYYRVYCATASVGNPLLTFKVDNTTPSNYNSGSFASGGRIGKGTSSYADDKDAMGARVFEYNGALWTTYNARRSDNAQRVLCCSNQSILEVVKINNSMPNNSTTNGDYGRIPASGSGSYFDSAGTLSANGFVNDSILYLFYSGSDGSLFRIGLATSTPALWSSNQQLLKVNVNIHAPTNTGPMTDGRIALGLSGSGDEAGVLSPSVVRLADNFYYMVYAGKNSGGNCRIYSATSSNLRVWYKVDNSIPPVSDTTNTNGRLGFGSSGKGDSNALWSPTLWVDRDNGVLWMWYAGQAADNGVRIYCATQTLYRIN